ncbi:MAG: DUF58 domain-containing protein [Lachnospiraceae bacterium]|nr:DUF58 domain-containing protein [Lachnospiraceae bacterium]
MLYFLDGYFYLLLLTILISSAAFFGMIAFLLRRYTSVSIEGAGLVEDRDHEFRIHLKVQNRSPLFANNAVLTINMKNTFLEEGKTHSVTIPIRPLGTTSITYPLISPHSGILHVQVESILIYDLFNLFAFRKDLALTKEIPIFPHPMEQKEELSFDFTEGEEELEESPAKGNDTTEVTDIREYIPGDRLQNIHWKLTAKKGELMVKEHAHLSSSQYVFYVELPKGDATVLDRILDTAYSIGLLCCSNHQAFTLLWYSSYTESVKHALVTSEYALSDAFLEILYEPPQQDVEGIRTKIPALSGHHHFITIGEDYVFMEPKED